MSESSPALARVAIFARPDDPLDLREVLQEELGLNKVDAAVAASHAPGLLPQKLPPDVAERVVRAIGRLGLRAVAVPAESLPDLDAAERVHHLRCSESGLELCNLAGEVDRCWPWEQLKLISVGRVPLETLRHYVTDTVLHANPVPPDPYLPGGAMHGYEGWLLFEPPLRVLRIDSEHLNYEYLGAEKTTSGTANFERLIAELVTRAPHAFLPPATRKYLTRGPVLDYDFASSEELQEYTLTEYLLSQQVA
jgi:hypothetical protein